MSRGSHGLIDAGEGPWPENKEVNHSRRMSMKSHRYMLSVVLLSLSTLAFAQHDMQKPVAQSDAQKSFDKMKTLAGPWQGPVTTDPPEPDIQGKVMQVLMRVTSMGHTLMHEARGPERPDDPITMFVVDGDRLLLTHYCDADNRPRMVGKMSPDGKAVEFEFLDVTGNLQYGHMQHAVFTFIDANHHTEDWTFVVEGKQGPTPVHAHFDLQRKN
jgi:hypothetical protein